MSIFDKDKDSKFDDLIDKNIREYVEHKVKEINKFGPFVPNAYENCQNKYIEAVLFGVDYLRIVFTNNKLDSNDSLEFDLNNMCNSASEETRKLIESPKLSDDIIFIIDGTTSPHFHINVDNETIDEADDIAELPNYNCMVNNDKLCSFFKGLTVYEARDLLKQMNLLPENSELEVSINFYDESKEVHKNYFLSIIYMLLKTNVKYDVKRARILADNMEINFDFTPYEDGKVLDGGIKKKTPPKL